MPLLGLPRCFFVLKLDLGRELRTLVRGETVEMDGEKVVYWWDGGELSPVGLKPKMPRRFYGEFFFCC